MTAALGIVPKVLASLLLLLESWLNGLDEYGAGQQEVPEGQEVGQEAGHQLEV